MPLVIRHNQDVNYLRLMCNLSELLPALHTAWQGLWGGLHSCSASRFCSAWDHQSWRCLQSQAHALHEAGMDKYSKFKQRAIEANLSLVSLGTGLVWTFAGDDAIDHPQPRSIPSSI